MAKTRGYWGIDIGQCALKALRCKWDEAEAHLVADAYDFIEYPKILSQPDADPEQLVRDAMEEFLSRNDLAGDHVSISVSGQVGLARFFKPPPVDTKTLPKVVEFEAKQQIPFPLQDVIWDYQQLGGMVVDNLLIDAEVGIFAMKREAVFRALKPYLNADVEVDIVQLTPLANYNFVLHEVLTDVPDIEEIDPDNPPPSLVVLSIGTDTTDLVITDGYKLWLRNIPIGGSHFTKQLSRDLKLTYAKAEHLKRNARQAEDPKTIFQAMRPVFSDLVTEIQRSINFFQGIEKHASIANIVMLGNASKLPGLRQYLAQHLETEILKLSSFSQLSGEAIQQPTFENNILSYSVCYGLCLQGVKKSRIKTNLLPREFKIERLIRAKKPWALASIGFLMLAFAFSLMFKGYALSKVDPERVVDDKTWPEAASKVKSVASISSNFLSQHSTDKEELEKIKALAEEVTGVSDGRRLWPELLSVIAMTRPSDPRLVPGEIADPEKVPYDDRNVVYIESVESEHFTDLGEWFNEFMQTKYNKDLVDSGILTLEGNLATAAADAPAAPAAPTADETTAYKAGAAPPPLQTTVPQAGENPLTGQSGWVIEIKAYHYNNSQARIRAGLPAGASWVRQQWLNKMRETRVKLPGSDELFSLKELGIDFIVVAKEDPVKIVRVPNLLHPDNRGGSKSVSNVKDQVRQTTTTPGPIDKSKTTKGDDSGIKRNFEVRRFDFKIQFVWQPVGLNKRLEMAEERRKLAEAAAAAAVGSETENTEASQLPVPADPAAVDPAAVDPAAVDPAEAVDPAAPKADEVVPPDPAVPAE
jgi:type IV pilus assembly protein PilM